MESLFPVSGQHGNAAPGISPEKAFAMGLCLSAVYPLCVLLVVGAEESCEEKAAPVTGNAAVYDFGLDPRMVI